MKNLKIIIIIKFVKICKRESAFDSMYELSSIKVVGTCSFYTNIQRVFIINTGINVNLLMSV